MQAFTKQSKFCGNFKNLLNLNSFKFSSQISELKKTALYDFHVKNGGKMVPFAGYSMPVQYGKFGVGESTIHTRQNASVFDVSHMGQLKFSGSDVIPFLESILVSSIKPLKSNQGKYTLMTNENGGIIDDLIVGNRVETKGYHYMVINAGRIKEDLEHINNQLLKFNGEVSYELLTSFSLLALQGPKSVEILENLIGKNNYDFNSLKFFFMDDININGINCQISRSGYTGEDGFEISVSSDNVLELINLLLDNNYCKLAGLGSRDSLRLEAGLCLYGHDLNENTTPVEADLLWTMSKKRQENGIFLGSNIIKDQIKLGYGNKKRIALKCNKGSSPREGKKIYDLNNNIIGYITSGGPSPCLDGIPIAMGYIEFNNKENIEYTKIDTKLKVELRQNKLIDAIVTKLPFVQKGYFQG